MAATMEVGNMRGCTVRSLATRLVMVEHGHDLDLVLSEWRREGVSLQGCAARLARRYGVEVTYQTIRTWTSD